MGSGLLFLWPLKLEGEHMEQEWISDCCGEPQDEKFGFNDFLTYQPIGICSKCKEHVSFSKSQEGEE